MKRSGLGKRRGPPEGEMSLTPFDQASLLRERAQQSLRLVGDLRKTRIESLSQCLPSLHNPFEIQQYDPVMELKFRNFWLDLCRPL